MPSTPKSLAFKATLVLDPQYEYLRKSCHDIGGGYAQLRHRKTKEKVLLHRYLHELENIIIPDGMTIDHADRNPANNQLSNLKIASLSENNCNRSVNKDSKTGILGLSIANRSKIKQILHAQVNVKGKKRETKYFELDQEQEAITWLKETRARLHGDFANKD